MSSSAAGSTGWFIAQRATKKTLIFISALCVFTGVGSSLQGATKASASGPAQRVTFSQLAACPLVLPQAGQDAAALEKQLSEPIRAVAGKRIEITGYMLPLVMENGQARELLLMRNTMACCYGQSPSANEYLVVRTPPGLRVVMDIPVTLRGILRIAPVVMGGTMVEFYDLDEAVFVEQ